MHAFKFEVLKLWKSNMILMMFFIGIVLSLTSVARFTSIDDYLLKKHCLTDSIRLTTEVLLFNANE